MFRSADMLKSYFQRNCGIKSVEQVHFVPEIVVKLHKREYLSARNSLRAKRDLIYSVANSLSRLL